MCRTIDTLVVNFSMCVTTCHNLSQLVTTCHNLSRLLVSLILNCSAPHREPLPFRRVQPGAPEAPRAQIVVATQGLRPGHPLNARNTDPRAENRCKIKTVNIIGINGKLDSKR